MTEPLLDPDAAEAYRHASLLFALLINALFVLILMDRRDRTQRRQR